MSDSEETIYSESERSEDSDSEGSLVDFVVDDDEEEELEACPSCHAEICVSNIITKKRRRAEVVLEESDDCEGDDSDNSYVPSETGDSSSEGSECSEGE
jgi:hypothetical protein